MDDLKVTLMTSLKVNANQIIPAGKQFSGDPRKFPSWLIAEMDSGSSCLNILTLGITPPKQEAVKKEVVTSVEESQVSETPIVEEPVRRTRRSRIG